MRADHELIGAISTPSGTSGIAVVRLSGDGADTLAQRLTAAKDLPPARTLAVRKFYDSDSRVIDEGMAVLFPAPASFTGQDVLELHCHGGPAVTQSLLTRCIELGARPARSGEFSLRAYLNEKIDLAQAEAICDLINASTEAGARAAARSVAGVLSAQAEKAAAQLAEARIIVEAHLDFPEEDIPPHTASGIAERIRSAADRIADLLRTGRQGTLLNQGIRVAVVGEPNVGKSSLVNRLCGEDAAIVSPIPGTTRDAVRQQAVLSGVRAEFVDTAGIQDTKDPVEAEGIGRAVKAASQADLVVLVLAPGSDGVPGRLSGRKPDLVVHNKIDLTGESPVAKENEVWLSAKDRQGLDLLEKALLECIGHEPLGDVFMARPRQIDALERALSSCKAALATEGSPELVAEELRCAHDALGEITGKMAPDDLLGEIFSRFCIGK